MGFWTAYMGIEGGGVADVASTECPARHTIEHTGAHRTTIDNTGAFAVTIEHTGVNRVTQEDC